MLLRERVLLAKAIVKNVGFSTTRPMIKRRRDGECAVKGKVSRPRRDVEELDESAVPDAPDAIDELPHLALSNHDFAEMRTGGAVVVDKTGAIADLLNYQKPGDKHRLFFARPRKFGKSFTLSTAAEMLAAGELPDGVDPWPGFKKVDVDSVFSGTEVYSRLKKSPAELGGLLQQAHFVIKLSLGGVLTGADMKAGIISNIARVARAAFGKRVQRTVAMEPTPEAALGTLVGEVPDAVPVALLVDGEVDPSTCVWLPCAGTLRAFGSHAPNQSNFPLICSWYCFLCRVRPSHHPGRVRKGLGCCEGG